LVLFGVLFDRVFYGKQFLLSLSDRGLNCSGTGALTRNIAMAFPKAQIYCLDLSPHYLNHAQRKLSEFKRVSYLVGNAENLPFKDESFDAVYSCYLFHELPKEVREKVLEEKIRVLKPKGFLGIVDSLQMDDDETMNWALEEFPIDFHEPFYKNYIQTKTETQLQRYPVKNVEADLAFFTKIVWGEKSLK